MTTHKITGVKLQIFRLYTITTNKSPLILLLNRLFFYFNISKHYSDTHLEGLKPSEVRNHLQYYILRQIYPRS